MASVSWKSGESMEENPDEAVLVSKTLPGLPPIVSTLSTPSSEDPTRGITGVSGVSTSDISVLEETRLMLLGLHFLSSFFPPLANSD